MMQYTSIYQSPLGAILLAADDVGLVGAWFQGAKHYARCLAGERVSQVVPVLQSAQRWLDLYFAGKQPQALPPLHFIGTPFQIAVWQLLLKIPYGQTTTYATLARQLTLQEQSHLAARAVGNAVARNNLSIFVPCHRVVGAQQRLTGYAGGLDKKSALLQLEGAL